MLLEIAKYPQLETISIIKYSSPQEQNTPSFLPLLHADGTSGPSRVAIAKTLLQRGGAAGAIHSMEQAGAPHTHTHTYILHIHTHTLHLGSDYTNYA